METAFEHAVATNETALTPASDISTFCPPLQQIITPGDGRVRPRRIRI